MSKAAGLLASISGSFWFAPSLIALALSGAAFAALAVDAGHYGAGLGFVAQDVDGARVALSTIAGGMMTVASIVFSLTFVALTTMSSQLGPRILTFFMHDRPTQIVLGAFIGTFLFALIVLLRTGGEDHFAPGLSLSLAVALAVASFGLMIYFVHHIAASIQADVLVARLGRQLIQAIDDMAARDADSGAEPIEPRENTARAQNGVTASAAGYVQFIDIEALAGVARDAGGTLELQIKPADFVIEGTPMLRCAGDPSEIEAPVRAAIHLGPQRTPAQQAHFEFTALTEVAVRALSPGVNDPFTAIACINRLTEGLVHAARRLKQGDAAYRRDGRLLLIERRRDFADFLDAAFAPIRAHGRADALVTARIVWGYETLERFVTDQTERRMVAEALAGLRADVETHMASQRDRDGLLARIARVSKALPAAP